MESVPSLRYSRIERGLVIREEMTHFRRRALQSAVFSINQSISQSIDLLRRSLR